MPPAVVIILGAFLAALAVGLGAIGAHALKSELSPEQLATYNRCLGFGQTIGQKSASGENVCLNTAICE
jgi:hypothetical protein